MTEDRIFMHIAHSLAREYTDLFYVNMDTGEYIDYRTDDPSGVLTVSRQGSDFFDSCKREAQLYIPPEDRAVFVHAMDKDFLADVLKRSGIFEMTYRRIKDERTFYVRMRVTRPEEGKPFIVIAVSDIDELMKKRFAEQQIREERVIYARLHALTGNFIVVYVADPETGKYREFSATDSYTKSFAQAREGTDFFAAVRKSAPVFNHPDDLEYFLSAFTKEKVMAEISRFGLFTLDYRIMMDGSPLHVQLKAALVDEEEGTRLVVGLINVDAQYRQKEISQEIARQMEVYNQITERLAEQYDFLFYIDIDTGTYTEIASTDEYKKLKMPTTGDDFFANSRRTIRKYVHPEDQERILRLHFRDTMLENLKGRKSFSLTYRLVTGETVHHMRHTEIMARDGKHLIICIKNIDEEVRENLAQKEARKKSVTYTQIAETLASHFDLIYYIDCETLQYAEFSIRKKSGELKVQDEGDDFFAAAQKNADRLIYSEDRERIKHFLDRDRLISQLENRRQLTEDYRMNIGGGKTQYTRMSVTYSSDRSHFIICIENREKDVRREQEYLAELSTANELARRDDLTHTKNSTAYREAEQELQKQLGPDCEPFGLVICDINGLKVINDTEGHKAGDEYIKSSCALICRTFRHSPVFRIGGDEFAVILRGADYADRKALLSSLQKQVGENIRIGSGPVLASGLAEYLPSEDRSVEDVFNRADTRMYTEKARLKEQKLLQESHSFMNRENQQLISEDRRLMLDTLFRSFEVVSEGTYVYLCDMKYDFSRWSKNAVDTYGLPSEYMYGAGDLWENRIHPEDRAAYHQGIEEIFTGNVADHDMQYRARRVTGEYDVCTCRGVVIRDPAGEPDYFAGTIRNHGLQGHIDTLTGLRNQYGFFEDLEACIKRNAEVSVLLFGISKFSEINEMYGYHFGNRVLQRYARIVFETVGNSGHTYRIDGTKCAVISSTLSIDEFREVYHQLRTRLHENFETDGKKVLLEPHCGAVRVNSFDVDSQTVYACLNFADEESKMLRKGDLVEFRNNLTEENHERLEMLHAIRASVLHDFRGFFLLYQPVVDAQTEQLVGAEALLRWKGDPYGLVPPDEFIPVLEPDPLFPTLGEWVLREAILAAKQFLKLYPGFVINVNLSYSQLEKPDFADMVLCLLKELDYPPEHLCLEITERCRLLDMDLLKNVIAALKSRNILIAMDDFGTGFSSLGILREVPLDTLKIDRSFISTIEESETERRLVRNIIDMADIIGAKVCAEGVETAKMRDILRDFQVNCFQGYYYSKPIPQEQLEKWRQ